MQHDVIVYSEGPLSLSACASAALGREAVEAEVNRVRPSGTEGGWQISSDKQFATGQPMPCPCERDADRQHWLLHC